MFVTNPDDMDIRFTRKYVICIIDIYVIKEIIAFGVKI